MAVTDQSAIAFCNTKVRQYADSRARDYVRAKDLVNAWNALGMSVLIPNDSTVVSDGSPADGRSAVTGAKITAIITRAQETIADYEANTNAKLNTILAVAVNTLP